MATRKPSSVDQGSLWVDAADTRYARRARQSKIQRGVRDVASYEIGGTGLRSWAGNIREQTDERLNGRSGAMMYKEMYQSDPMAGGLMHFVRAVTRKVQWSAVPGKIDDARAQEAAQLLRSILDDMEIGWESVLEEMLMCLVYGWSISEIVYKIRQGPTPPPENQWRSKYDDGKLGIAKIAPRSQDSLERWDIDEHGVTRGLWQTAYPSMRVVYLPIEKCLHITTTSNKLNPEGESWLRPCVRPYTFARDLDTIEAIVHERGAGLPVMEVPLDVTSSSAVPAKQQQMLYWQDLVQSVRRDELSGLVIPSETNKDGTPTGYRFRLLTAEGSSTSDIDKTIKRHQSRIAIALISSFMMLGIDGGGGSYALAKGQIGLFLSALDAILDTMQEQFNGQIVRPLMEMNGYRGDELPKWQHETAEKVDIEVFAKALKDLASVDAVTIDDETRRVAHALLGLPVAGSLDAPVDAAGSAEQPAQIEPNAQDGPQNPSDAGAA